MSQGYIKLDCRRRRGKRQRLQLSWAREPRLPSAFTLADPTTVEAGRIRNNPSEPRVLSLKGGDPQQPGRNSTSLPGVKSRERKERVLSLIICKGEILSYVADKALKLHLTQEAPHSESGSCDMRSDLLLLL